MLETLTDNFETGVLIKKKIKKLKIVLHTESYFHITGYKQSIYLYSDENIKEKHKKEMINNGYKLTDAQNYMYIYYSFYDSDENNDSMLIPCQIYEKQIKSNLS